MADLWRFGALAAFFQFLCYWGVVVAGNDPVLTRISDPIEHAEGPHWHDGEQVLYYVDIAGKTLHRYDPATKVQKTISFDKPIGLVVPMKDQKHKFVVALGLDIAVLTWDWESGFHTVSTVTSVDKEKPDNRFNDGKADAKGRIWAGTMGYEDQNGVKADQGTLYRVDNDPSVPCKGDVEVTPVTVSNGLAWTSDNKILYYIDTPTRKVSAFDFDLAKGQISNRRTVFEFGDDDGLPDGMTIDTDGNLWIACWKGSQVIQVNPTTKKLIRQIKMPVSRVTSVVFGGAKLDTLYVTTMRGGLTKEELKKEPLAGSVWEITGLGVTGTLNHKSVVNCKCNR